MIRYLKTPRRGFALLALLGASLPAMAQDEPTIDLTLDGYFTQSVNLVDVDTKGGASFEDEVLAQEGEIHFKAKTILPSGTEIGVRVELEAEGATDDLIDEHYLYLKGDWGKVILGAENGVGHLMQVRAPRFVPGLKMFDNSVTEEIIEDAYDLQLGSDVIEDAHMSTKLEHISGDANKFFYLTPKVGGLQVGVSFTPNNRDRNGGENNVATSYPGDGSHRLQEDIIEMAFRFTGSYRGFGYRLSHSNVSSDTLLGTLDPESNSTGLQVYWNDWVFGANLSEYENLQALPDDKYSGSANIETLNYALKYKQGDRYWGIGFTQSEESTVASSGDRTDYEEIMIGGGRKLMKGVEFGYYYQMTEAELTTANAKNTAETETLGLTLALAF
jgi:outer membrane protein OmpU